MPTVACRWAVLPARLLPDALLLLFPSLRAQDAVPQVKRSVESRGDPEDTLVLLRQPRSALQRLPGCKLYYSEAIRGIPHPLVKLVRLAPGVNPGNGVFQGVSQYRRATFTAAFESLLCTAGRLSGQCAVRAAATVIGILDSRLFDCNT